MSWMDRLDRLTDRHAELTDLLSRGNLDAKRFQSVSRELADLDGKVAAIAAYRAALTEEGELAALAGDPSQDKEMRGLAAAELEELRERLPELEHAVKLALVPKDETDNRSAIVEIRAGTGGDEAGLFAGDLFRMYQRYAQTKGWRMDIMDTSEQDIGGYKEIIVEISGDEVFGRLKYESGVHRVQRVPETEGGGRIHTSAATVAVLPEAEEVDIAIEEKDLRIDTFRSQGAGGQHVNTTDSAVRITHLPSGIVVSCQDEKSQHKNRAKAMKVLRARLFEAERERLAADRAATRKGQVGSGDRSERIRTYNFPQGRVTDHRINLTLYKLDRVIAGEALDELIDALILEDQTSKLAELETD